MFSFPLSSECLLKVLYQEKRGSPGHVWMISCGNKKFTGLENGSLAALPEVLRPRGPSNQMVAHDHLIMIDDNIMRSGVFVINIERQRENIELLNTNIKWIFQGSGARESY